MTDHPIQVYAGLKKSGWLDQGLLGHVGCLKPQYLDHRRGLSTLSPKSPSFSAPWSSESHRGNELEELGLDRQPQPSV